MTYEQQKELWGAVARGLLMIVRAIYKIFPELEGARK